MVVAAEAFEVGEPFEFADRELQSIGQCADSFNRRNRPRLRGGDGLHSRRIGQERFDHELAAKEAWGAEQELDDIAMPGPDLPGWICLDESAGERREPARRSGQNQRSARNDLLDGRIAREECLGKRRRKGPVRHDQRREILQRVRLCVRTSAPWRSAPSRDEISVLHVPLG